MSISTRKPTNGSDYQTWFASMYFSTHTFYFLLILISIGWNAYNTHQYRILNERQTKLENILTESLSSSSSILSFSHQPALVEQWFKRIFYLLRRFKSTDTAENNNTNLVTQSHTNIIRERRYIHGSSSTNCLCPPGPKGEKGERGFAGFPGEMGPKGERGHPGSIVWNGIKGEKGEPGRDGSFIQEEMFSSSSQGKFVRDPPGLLGEKGNRGPPGHSDIIKAGLPGRDGLPGQKGNQGETGARGLPGEKGEKGEKGWTGKRGFPGRIGLPGPAGMDAFPCPREVLLSFENMCNSCCQKS